MRNPVSTLLAFLLAGLAPLSAQDGFKSIFDGKTLAGWDGDPAMWRVEDGVLIGESPAGPRPPDDWHAELTIVLAGEASPATPAVSVNASASLDVAADEPAGASRRIRYTLPTSALADEANRIEIQSPQSVKVTWVDILIGESQ